MTMTINRSLLVHSLFDSVLAATDQHLTIHRMVYSVSSRS